MSLFVFTLSFLKLVTPERGRMLCLSPLCLYASLRRKGETETLLKTKEFIVYNLFRVLDRGRRTRTERIFFS